MAERTDEDLRRLQEKARKLLKQKEEIDSELRGLNRNMASIHNNRLLIT